MNQDIAIYYKVVRGEIRACTLDAKDELDKTWKQKIPEGNVAVTLCIEYWGLQDLGIAEGTPKRYIKIP